MINDKFKIIFNWLKYVFKIIYVQIYCLISTNSSGKNVKLYSSGIRLKNQKIFLHYVLGLNYSMAFFFRSINKISIAYLEKKLTFLSFAQTLSN